MAAAKKATHVVTHKRLYLAVKGKLQHIKPGSNLTLSAKQAEKMGGRVQSLSDAATTDLTKAEDEAAILNAAPPQ